MSGSRKWFVYTTDAGDTFGLNMDESNGEVVTNTDYAPLIDDGIIYALPRNVRPRSALYRSPDGRSTRRIVVTDPAATIATLPTSFVVQAIDGNPAFQLELQSFRGEEIRKLTGIDTAQDDGDAT